MGIDGVRGQGVDLGWRGKRMRRRRVAPRRRPRGAGHALTSCGNRYEKVAVEPWTRHPESRSHKAAPHCARSARAREPENRHTRPDPRYTLLLGSLCLRDLRPRTGPRAATPRPSPRLQAQARQRGRARIRLQPRRVCGDRPSRPLLPERTILPLDGQHLADKHASRRRLAFDIAEHPTARVAPVAVLLVL